MHGRVITTLLGVSLVLLPSLSHAETCAASSEKHRVALLELYTSEGCSSCPPADVYLSRLEQDGISRDKVVPLSMHVDYWNYIGWKDPYSDPVYTKRQREVAWRNRLSSMYTPQMVLNGADYRGWRRLNLSSLLKQLNSQAANASMKMDWQSLGKGEASVSVDINAQLADSQPLGESVLHVMLYENNLVSEIEAGENNGRTLKHDYVVRKMYQTAFKGEAKLSTQVKFNLADSYNTDELGMAVFVQNKRSGEILQAMASPMGCKR